MAEVDPHGIATRLRPQPQWVRVAAGVTAALALLLIAPYWYHVKFGWPQVVAAAAVLGYLSRRNVLDGVLYAVAHLAAAWVEVPAGAQLLACLSLGLLSLTGRPRFALAVGAGLLGLLVAGTEVKLRLAGSVLTWQDLRYFFLQFEDNVGVVASQPTLVMAGLAASLVIAAAITLAWRFEAPAIHRAPAVRLLLRAVLPVLVVLWCAHGLDQAARRVKKLDAWMMGQKSPNQRVSTFLSTLDMTHQATFTRVGTADFERAVRSVPAGGMPGIRPADIVVFLQESQFNPASLPGCPSSLCAIEAFGKPPGTTDFGELRVHTESAGTWLSEFTLATGVPHNVYGLAGDFASFNIAPGVKRSLIRSLKAAGYHTVAVYPVGGFMMNARMAYRSYGFDEFLDARELGLPGNYFTTDAEVHGAAMKVLERARQGGKPVFLLALTIFNHSEHGIKMERVPAETVAAARRVFAPVAQAEKLADYVWRSREFDAAYAATRDAVFGGGRPSVLAWFGDHQPPFSGAPLLRDGVRSTAGRNMPHRYITWYNVSSNLRSASPAVPRPLDIAFLPGVLAERAMAPLDDWLRANVVARERCAGLLVECSEPAWRDAYLSYLLGELQSIE
jgi:hypothetical protein